MHRTADHQPQHGRRQRGMALIIVLGMISLFGVLTAMIVADSRVSAIVEKVNADRALSRYAAESATGYAQWMIACEKRRPQEGEEGWDAAAQQWQADGRTISWDMPNGMKVDLLIRDANTGHRLKGLRGSNRNRLVNNLAGDDVVAEEDLNVFFDTLADYVDRDSNYSPNGMEVDDYSAVGLDNFPRNGVVQMREEVFWIREVSRLIDPHGKRDGAASIPDSYFRVTPPLDARGRVSVHGGDPTGRSSFWSLDPTWLQFEIDGGLSKADLDLIRECQQQSERSAAGAESCLGFELYQLIRSKVEFDPARTRLFTIEGSARLPGSSISRRVVATLNLHQLPTASSSTLTEGKPQTVQLWRRQIY
jgi:hypothetical protein